MWSKEEVGVASGGIGCGASPLVSVTHHALGSTKTRLPRREAPLISYVDFEHTRLIFLSSP